MNIHIDEPAALILLKRATSFHIIGSRLYGTHNKNSDVDILVVYESLSNILDTIYQTNHQFQFKQPGLDLIFTTVEQFYANWLNGDSTINPDVAMYSEVKDKFTIEDFRFYNCIKAYLGFAKRDIKDIKKPNKVAHIMRGLFTASMLLDGSIPTTKQLKLVIQEAENKTLSSFKKYAVDMQQVLRSCLNKEYEANNIPKVTTTFLNRFMKNTNETECDLVTKLVESNNIKEFKY